MNAQHLLIEIELMMFELAEAETHEKAARAKRYKATQRMALVYHEMKTALEKAETKRKKTA